MPDRGQKRIEMDSQPKAFVRLVWFAAIWIASVGALAVVAYAIRTVLRL